MKYMLMFCGDAEYRAAWDGMSKEQQDGWMGQVGKWFGEHADTFVTSHALRGPETAKTVRLGFDGSSVVTDGPFVEAKEAIGGYAIFDVPDEAAALELAKQWPARGVVEVRPVVER